MKTRASSPSRPKARPTLNAILDDMVTRHPSLGVCRPDLRTTVRLMAGRFSSGGTLFTCGNGGSAADAEHWAGELLKSFECRRPPPTDPDLDPGLRQRLEQGLPAIPLTGFTSLRSAFANDREAVCDYAQLVTVLGRPGDMLAAISTSGNAANLGLAVQMATARGLATVGLTGAHGGALADLCTVCIRVPAQRTADVQELHVAVYHALCRCLEALFFPVRGHGPKAR